MTRWRTWRAALRAQSHIDQKFTLKPAEAGASSGRPLDALLTGKCVKFISSEAEWLPSHIEDSDVEAEENYVAITHYVVLPFDPEFASLARLG